MWRTIGRLTSWVRLQPLLFITSVPSLARPVDVWYCFTTGKMFCQRLWILEPSWNIQRMSPNVRDEPLSSALAQILIFDIRKYYTLHACHSHHTVWILIVLWLYFFSKTTRADRRHVSRWLRSSTTAIFISLAQLQLASIRAVPCCSWNQTILHVRPNNRGAGSTSLTHSVNIFSLFLCLFFRLRLRALKQNNVEACDSSTRCKLQTKGVVTGRGAAGRGVKVSMKGRVNRGGHDGASMLRSATRSGALRRYTHLYKSTQW